MKRVVIMKKITNKNHVTFISRAKYIVFSAMKTALATAAIMLIMKWIGNVLEIVSNHISVGTGMFVIFAAACFFIYTDSKNSIEQEDKNKKIYVNNR